MMAALFEQPAGNFLIDAIVVRHKNVEGLAAIALVSQRSECVIGCWGSRVVQRGREAWFLCASAR